MKREYVYKGFERFWHWTQAALVIILMLTGLDIHFGGINIFGFEQAVTIHKYVAWGFVSLIVLAFFWHLTTGEWRHYTPTKKHIREFIHYYAIGIFKNEPHPAHDKELSKYNPLQRLVYLGLNLLVIPVLVTTGFLYYFYNDWSSIGLGGMSLGPIAIIHTAAAYAVIVFMIAHVYLTTTGRTPLSNIKAMITGYEEIEEDQDA